MFKARFVGSLASMQSVMLLVAAACALFGHPLSWVVVLWPLETLLFVGLVFWVVFGLIVRAVTSK
jgi:hypothetical protein